MKFDLILTNPPFQDSVNRKKTPHKLWIDFTLAIFDRYLKADGSLIQVSPASFSSPSNVVLDLMAKHELRVLRVGTGHHFPHIGSTFADYWIRKTPNPGKLTKVTAHDDKFSFRIGRTTQYLPNDLSKNSLSIHKKVMFTKRPRLQVEWDYVTGHNIRRYDAIPTLVEERDDAHPFPMFHTNRSTWWSSVRQDWADDLKVMWTRSGYSKPFFDPGTLGGTDMVYFVRVSTEAEGLALEGNLRSQLISYILRSAKWSGFGNERVFTGLPDLPRTRVLADEEMFELFELTDKEVEYVQQALEPRRRKNGRT